MSTEVAGLSSAASGEPAPVESNSSYRKDIQGLRAVAVLSVVLFHADLPVSGGFVGVDVFFVISGFVIAGLLLRELDSNDSIDLRRFYSRRVRRLVPALGVMLLVVGLLSALILSPLFPQPVALRTGAWASASGGNLYLWLFGGGYFGPSDEGNPFLHTWSLGVEEQFYLVFPALMAAVWAVSRRRTGSSRGQLRTVLLVIVVASFAVSVIFTQDILGLQQSFPAGEKFAFYGPLSRAWEFAVGVLLALAMGSRRTLGPAALAWVGALVLVATFFVLDGSIPFPGLASVPPVAATILLLLNGSPAVRAILEHDVMVWIGDRSYGWYLWHWPFIVFARLLLPNVAFVALIAAVLSLIPTVISYRFVESRFRAASGAPTGGAVRISLVFAAVPLVLLALGSIVPASSWGLPEHPERDEVSASSQAQCNEYWATTEACTFEPDGAAEGTVLLVGDSHAGAISHPVLEAANNTNYRVIVRTVQSCPFLIETDHFSQACLDHNHRLIELAADVQPDVLIVANRSNIYPVLMDLGLEDSDIEVEYVGSDDSMAKWEQFLGTTLQEVSPHVDRVVLFSVAPSFGSAQYDRSLPSVLWPDGLISTTDRDEMQEIREPIIALEAELLRQLPNPTMTIDPVDMFCDEVCRYVDDDGRFLYRDPDHMTLLGSSPLIKDFEAVLAE